MSEDKLAIALEALELAVGIIEYCQGDAWERDCTKNDRQKFQELYDKLNPPVIEKKEDIVINWRDFRFYKSDSNRFTCPHCAKQFYAAIALRDHLVSKHQITSKSECRKIIKGIIDAYLNRPTTAIKINKLIIDWD